MTFTSLSFLLFLGILIALYYHLPRACQPWLLLIGSYCFYLFAGGYEVVGFLLGTTLLTYFGGVVLKKCLQKEKDELSAHGEFTKEERKAYKTAKKKHRFRVLILFLFLGFGLLAVMKYTGFAVSVLRSLGANLTVPHLLLPLGISFYVFQSMGYLIDVYRGKAEAESNFFRLALFVSFFPQLVQGPISRFGDLEPQFFGEHPFRAEPFRAGLLRAAYGYFKKMVVADTAMIAVRSLVEEANERTGIYVLFLILLYSVEIYGDFTGGIDITLGISQMLGIRLAENFNRPFSSRSTKEYWNRWHITMGSWFTDYVFYPLSVCKPMQSLSKWSRAHLGSAIGKRLPVYVATIFTWFLTGLWHGAGWNFIVWGLLNCLVILVSGELRPLWDAFHRACPKFSESSFWHGFQAVRTFLLMGLIRSLDCYRDVGLTFRLWGSILTKPSFASFFGGGFLELGLSPKDYAVILVGIAVMTLVSRLGVSAPLRDRIAKRPILTCLLVCLAVAVILIFGSYGIGFNAGDFIYKQF